MPAERPPRSPTPILSVLLLAGVSFALSQTLVVPALPSISREFGASATATSWVLTGFLLSASVATPIVGKLGDLFGKGRVLTIVLLLFALGGAVCALSGSIGVLIAGRVIQVPQSQVGIATGISTVTRTVGGAFGAAVATAILAGHTLAGTPVPTEGAYEAAFLMSAAGALLAIGAAPLVPTRAAEAAAARAAEASASA